MKDTPHILNHTTPETRKQMLYSTRTETAAFRVDPELWSRFREECKFRGVSTCHVLEALMEAWIEGQKAEATVIKPVVVNLTMQHVVQRPRRSTPYTPEQDLEFVGYRQAIRGQGRLKVFREKPSGRILEFWAGE